MEKPCLEVMIISRESVGGVQKRSAAQIWEEELAQLPVSKKLRMDSPTYPKALKSSLPLHPSTGSVTSTKVPPATQPQTAQQSQNIQLRTPYSPSDFTSDELDPAYEWPREAPSAKRCKTGQCGTDVLSLLRRTLGPFPLGLRLNKLEAMLWKEHNVKLGKVSVEQGYRNSLKFLETVPGIEVKHSRKTPSRCLVLLDPAYIHFSLQPVPKHFTELDLRDPVRKLQQLQRILGALVGCYKHPCTVEEIAFQPQEELRSAITNF